MRHIIVLSQANDSVAIAFTDYAQARGASCERLELADAAERITLSVDEADGRLACSPHVSWFLRSLDWAAIAELDEQDRFHWAERFAVVWAAAAASPLAINRPAEWGWAGRVAASACVTEGRCASVVDAPRTHEVFSSGLEADAALYVEEVSTGRQWRPHERPTSAALLRSRALPPCRGWDRVIVVGRHGMRVTTADIGPHDLEEKSVQTACSLGLSFASVSWGIPENGGPPVLARVNPFPSAWELQPVWAQARDRLLSLFADGPTA